MISLTSPVETRAHRWPAGAKLAALCLASAGLFALRGPGWHLLVLGAVLLLYALPGRVFWRSGIGHLWMLWPFVAIVGLYHLATNSLGEGAEIILRMISAVALANLVTMTTRLSEMIAVLQILLAPLRRFGLNPRALELAIAMVIRFTPVLLARGQGLVESWRARSRRRPSWRIVLPFTISALEEADHVAEALKARGGLSQRRKENGT